MVCLPQVLDLYAPDTLAGCGPAIAGTVLPPTNALLYLSVKSTGNVTYNCGPNGDKLTSTEQGNVVSEEGYKGTIFTNPDGFLQIDVGVFDPDVNAVVNNSVVFASTPDTSYTDPSLLPEARWAILSTDGAKPDAGGLPPLAYATRDDISGGGPPTNCKPNLVTNVPYQATYNLYTCDPAYLGPVPAPMPAPPMTPPIVFTQPPLPTIIFAPPTIIPVPAPPPQPQPIIAPSPAVVVPTPIVPAPVLPLSTPPPKSSAGAVTGRMAVAFAVAMALFVV